MEAGDTMVKVNDAEDGVGVEGYVEIDITEVELTIEVTVAVVLRAFIEDAGGGSGGIGVMKVECDLVVNSVEDGEDSSAVEVVNKILVVAEGVSADEVLCEEIVDTQLVRIPLLW